MYTLQLQRQRATRGVLTSHPAKLAKIGMRIKTLSDRRHNKIVRVLHGLRRELVKTRLQPWEVILPSCSNMVCIWSGCVGANGKLLSMAHGLCLMLNITFILVLL